MANSWRHKPPAFLARILNNYQLLVLRVLYTVCQEECIRGTMKEANGLEVLLNILSDEELTDLHDGD